MVQLWIRNALSVDAVKTAARVTWRREPSRTFERTIPGLWVDKAASEMGSFRAVGEEMTLSSNGLEEHLALVAKYPGDAKAYFITPNSAFEFKRVGWRLDACSLDPGSYQVRVRLRSEGGSQAEVPLRIVIQKDSPEILAEVLSSRSRYPRDD
jgi:hypothetical protein